MKVTLINHSDTLGGASVVSYRLMEALVAEGVDARMIVTDKRSDSPRVALAGNPVSRKAAFLAEHARIYAMNGFSRKNLFKISIASDGLPLHSHPWVKEADVVVLNWVNQGMLSLREIGKIAGMKPLVWTMHDMWCATGVCHHAHSCDGYLDRCGNCPLIRHGAVRHDMSRRTWQRKHKLYSRTRIRYVAVSTWLADKCHHSSLLCHKDISVIPNAFPLDRFSCARTPSASGKRVIVMGAARLDDDVKDFPLAIASLNALADSRPDIAATTEAVFFGNIRDKGLPETLRFPYRMLGMVDTGQLPEIYSGADVVLSTSRYETLPGTLVEGMASGCVAVATSAGGQSNIVEHLRTGYLCGSRKPASIARGLEWALDSGLSREFLRQEVATRFSAPEVARRYIELFNNIIRK